MIVWLNVPFADKDRAKRLGARWSPSRKKWYVENKEDLAPFLAWMDARLTKPVSKKRETPRAALTAPGR